VKGSPAGMMVVEIRVAPVILLFIAVLIIDACVFHGVIGYRVGDLMGAVIYADVFLMVLSSVRNYGVRIGNLSGMRYPK